MYLKAHQETHKQLSTYIKSLKGQLNLDMSHEISLADPLITLGIEKVMDIQFPS